MKGGVGGSAEKEYPRRLTLEGVEFAGKEAARLACKRVIGKLAGKGAVERNG